MAMVGSLRRRVAFAVLLRVRASMSGFALPGLRKENLEFLPLSAWIDLDQPLGEHPPVAWASEPVRCFTNIRARPRRTVLRS